MELSWSTKLRIVLVMGLGAVVIGYMCWPMAMPQDPAGVVRLSNLTIVDGLFLIMVSVVLGIVGYFLAWPYGSEIGLLAVPSGLAVWALRSSPLSQILLMYPAVAQRQAIFASLRWEPFVWLVFIAAGILGTVIARRLRPCPTPPIITAVPASQAPTPVNGALALIISVIVSHLLIVTFAQDVKIINSTVPCEPAKAQLVFGILVAFGFSGFLVRTTLKLDYLWAIPATAVLFLVGTTAYTHTQFMANIAQHLPAVCLPSVLLAALPVQMVSFGTLGTIIGYWLGIRYQYWRIHEDH